MKSYEKQNMNRNSMEEYTKEKMKLVYNKILCKESEEDDDTEENNDGIDLAEHLETE